MNIQAFKRYIENQWDDEDVLQSRWLERACWGVIAFALGFVVLPAIFRIIVR